MLYLSILERYAQMWWVVMTRPSPKLSSQYIVLMVLIYIYIDIYIYTPLCFSSAIPIIANTIPIIGITLIISIT